MNRAELNEEWRIVRESLDALGMTVLADRVFELVAAERAEPATAITYMAMLEAIAPSKPVTVDELAKVFAKGLAGQSHDTQLRAVIAVLLQSVRESAELATELDEREAEVGRLRAELDKWQAECDAVSAQLWAEVERRKAAEAGP